MNRPILSPVTIVGTGILNQLIDDSAISSSESRQLIQPMLNWDSGFWFPHGHVSYPKSIRLGQRDYGLLPQDWNRAFTDFKVFEKKYRMDEQQQFSESSYQSLVEALQDSPQQPKRVLLGHLLLAPLIFFGAGLQSSEWGWWRLLNQRARNHARLPSNLRPITAVLVRDSDRQSSFWSTRPTGLAPFFFKDWDEGWRKLLAWLDCHRSAS